MLAVLPWLAEHFSAVVVESAVAGVLQERAVLAVPNMVMQPAAPAVDMDIAVVTEPVVQPVAQVVEDQPQSVREVPAVQSKPAPVKTVAPDKPAKLKAVVAVEPVKPPEIVPRQSVDIPVESAADALVKPAPAEGAVVEQAQGDKSAAVDSQANASASAQQTAVQSAPVEAATSEVISTEPRFARAPAPPVYPAQAKRRQQQGTVWVEVRLNARGQQLALHVLRSSGVASLDKAALAAVRKWHFLPETRHGSGVSSRVHIPIEFAIAAKR